MPDLKFEIQGAEAMPFAAQPQIAFKLHIANARPSERIHNIVLRAQIQIEAPRRQHSAQQKQALRDLFGQPERWSQTLRPMLWTHANTVVPSFEESILTELPVACTFDFNVAATKYFHAINEGEIPLLFLFSGSVFYAAADAALQVAPIPWDREARFFLPASAWREMMDLYYPNSAWLSLRRDVFERLYQYKAQHTIPTWEEAIDNLLAAQEEPLRR
jgi:Family of unknown function (DUF6084)